MEIPQGPGARVPQTEEEGSQAASKCHLLHLGLWRTGTIILYYIHIVCSLYIHNMPLYIL